MRSDIQTQASERETAEAIRAWHRGERLSDEQANLVDIARRQVLARAHGAAL